LGAPGFVGFWRGELGYAQADMSERRAAFFDLDRTLVRVDTPRLFTRYRRKKGEATWRDSLQVAWWVLQYSAGLIDAPRVARKALEAFAGKDEAWLIKSCDEWFPQYVLPEIQARGREIVKSHRDAGDLVAIVTAAVSYVAKPVARELGIEHVVCSELEVDESGRFTGKVIEPMCYGEGKIVRAGSLLEQQGIGFDGVTFFSDSITDMPLLSKVAVPVAVNPDRRLLRAAKARGWQIQNW
jgi:HAD superfamily hydrolase (TIGR01490 family)